MLLMPILASFCAQISYPTYWRLKNMKPERNMLAILVILAIIPLICLTVFLLPQDTQNGLKLNTQNTDALTVITSTFVHADINHLLGNIVVFELFGFLLLFVNRVSFSTKFLLASLLTIIFLLPIFYNIAFVLLANALFSNNLSSFGLSTLVGGLIGLLVPSLVLMFKAELKKPIFVALFFMGLFCLTGSIIIFPYLSTTSWSMPFFLVLFSSGACLLFFPFYKAIGYGIRLNGKNEISRVAIVSISMLLLFTFLSGLFPTNIVQENGTSIVNIFAHYFGVFFGLTMPSAYLFVKHRIFFSLESKKRALP